MVKKPLIGGNSNDEGRPVQSAVVGGAGRGSIFLIARSLKTNRGITGLVVIIVVIGSAYVFYNRAHHSGVAVTQIPMGTKYIDNQLSTLKKNAPKDDASLINKLSYYDELMSTEANVGDYKAAVTAYEQRIALSTDGIDALKYYQVAKWYEQAGDKAGGIAALAKSEAALKAGNSGTGDYSSAQFESSIGTLRQELTQ